MAFDFLKTLFKKNTGTSAASDDIESTVPDLQENAESDAHQVLPEQAPAEIESIIREKLSISPDSPVKLLWNIFSNNSGDAEFKPLDYVYKPLIETNKLLNQISNSNKYIVYDENQREFSSFRKCLQTESIKLIKEIIQKSVKGDLDSFMNDINKDEFQKFLKKYSSYSGFDNFKFECNSKNDPECSKPFDSRIIMHVSKDMLHAWIMIIPPLNKGSEVNESQIEKMLADKNIIYGINKPLITAICTKKKYLSVFEIARGIDVAHGKDGCIIDRFPRKNIIKIREDEKGNLNYKELNNVRSVHKGDEISEIVYPVEGKDGKRLDGKVVSARSGKAAKIPKGRNTILVNEGKMLVAEKDGELVFKDGVFNVNELLTIENDVDNASGNINFAGDVLIKGDVREGFSVKAEGKITILGTAEGATIISDSDIVIQHGMTGGGKGIIRAGGDLKCIFLENCNACAAGNIEVDLVMYSEVSCGDSIVISGKKGSVTGGRIIAGKSITANVIGAANNDYLKTDLIIGCSPDMIKNERELRNSLKNVEENLFKRNQDIKYIEDNIKHMPESRISKLNQLKIQQKYFNMQKENIEKNLNIIVQQMEETARTCSLKCKTLNPIINIKVGENVYTLNKPLQDCKIYMNDKKAVLSSMSLAENIEF